VAGSGGAALPAVLGGAHAAIASSRAVKNSGAIIKGYPFRAGCSNWYTRPYPSAFYREEPTKKQSLELFCHHHFYFDGF
jgi:hypothetical protein